MIYINEKLEAINLELGCYCRCLDTLPGTCIHRKRELDVLLRRRNFFIVSGEVLTDAFGVPTTYKFLSIPMSRRLEFRRLILKLKPLHSWGILMITWV